MRSLLEALIVIQNCHISRMNEMDSSHGRIFSRHLYHVVLIGAAQGTGTEGDAVVLIVNQL